MIVEGGDDGRELAALLCVLVPAAVDGLVGQVIVVESRPNEAQAAICEDAGAELVEGLTRAIDMARADLLLLLPVALRLRPGWDESLRRHLERKGGPALICESEAGFLGRFIAPKLAGVLAPKARIDRSAADIEAVRRRLGRLPRLS